MNKYKPAASSLAILVSCTVLVVGCNPYEPVSSGVTSQTLVPDNSQSASGANDLSANCCKKCKEDATSTTLQSSKCGNCTACPDGDSTSCKCEFAAHSQMERDVKDVGKSTEEQDPKEKSASEDVDAAKVQLANTFAEDRDLFHFLLSSKDAITRKVTELENGVKTTTESDDPVVAKKIQQHVASMYNRVEDVRPIRMRDPLYRELFRHARKIKMTLKNTAKGIRVHETSDDPYVVKLIQSHAKVVSSFVEHGFEEARKNHLPPKP